VPFELARKLHTPLKRFFRDDPHVEVVVERRTGDRRAGTERRAISRDRQRAAQRRRVGGERRSSFIPAPAPALPARLQRYAGQLQFAERLEPSDLHTEDRDTDRLIAAAQAGDRDAFGVIYARYFDRVYTYVALAMRNGEEAQDAVQQVFLDILAALPRYEIRPGQPFRGWLFRIARNQVIRTFQRRKPAEPEDPAMIDRRRSHVQDFDPQVLDWLSDRELLMFVERLPILQRQVLTLRYLLDFSVKEISRCVDRSPEAVRQIHSRALRALEQRLSSIGRAPQRDRAQEAMVTLRRPAQVLRLRRFVLTGSSLPTRR
jgi:RNA polymerase sigma-70 factor (ECF subfamily)